ncbi:DUF269 domain-containing protein [Mesorhizobium sp.]|uniref:DUF269 domain-containing protein n=1 Tax=Mesorhizobium sp. TaxID=1871066 RepID=UPI00257D5181|nr:DUF269 domain-containing protein [Mesorhizobium sp.]
MDPELLADFIITKELRRKIRSSAIRIRTRCGGSYTARGRAIEERSGVMASPTTEMKPMGQRARAFTVGSWSFCRDVHRFGSEIIRKQADADTKLVDDNCSYSRRGAGVKKPIFEGGSCQTWMRW